MHGSLFNRGEGLTALHLQQLQQIVLHIKKEFPRSFFILDPLDEGDERNHNHIFPLFHIFGEGGTSVFMTSQPYPRDILEFISSDYRKIKIEAIEEDLVIYIGNVIDQDLHARCVIHKDIKDRFVARLVDVCKGM